MRQKQQIYFEDVETGMKLPTRQRQFTRLQVFLFSAAVHQPSSQFTNPEFARSSGLPDTVTEAPLQWSTLASMITDWIGEKGALKKVSFQNRRMVHPTDTLTFTARVTNKYVEGGNNVVEFDLQEMNQSGQVCVRGSAVAHLPSRPK